MSLTHLFAAPLFVIALSVAAQPIGIVTIAEGEATVMRASSKLRAVEGLALHADDIVHTADARLVRIELAPAGGALDLGPATKALLQPRFAAPHADRAAAVYLLDGWLKVTGGSGGALRIASPRLDLALDRGSAVMRVAPQSSFAFVETGGVRAMRRRDGQPGIERVLLEGQSWLEEAGAVQAPLARPPAAVLQLMPRAFADSLPLRAQRFASLPLRAEPLAYADVEPADAAPWLDGEPALQATLRQHRIDGDKPRAAERPRRPQRRSAPRASPAGRAPVHASSPADLVPSTSWAMP